MNTLPDNYKINENLSWESFKVSEDFDDSHKRLNFSKIEYLSDIFITYQEGGVNLTRAKKLCIMIGTKQALGCAIRNMAVLKRNTMLKDRLKG